MVGEREVGVSIVGERETGVSVLGEHKVGVRVVGEREVGVRVVGERELGVRVVGEREVGVSLVGVSAVGVSPVGVLAPGDRKLGEMGERGRGSPHDGRSSESLAWESWPGASRRRPSEALATMASGESSGPGESLSSEEKPPLSKPPPSSLGLSVDPGSVLACLHKSPFPPPTLPASSGLPLLPPPSAPSLAPALASSSALARLSRPFPAPVPDAPAPPCWLCALELPTICAASAR